MITVSGVHDWQLEWDGEKEDSFFIVVSSFLVLFDFFKTVCHITYIKI